MCSIPKRMRCDALRCARCTYNRFRSRMRLYVKVTVYFERCVVIMYECMCAVCMYNVLGDRIRKCAHGFSVCIFLCAVLSSLSWCWCCCWCMAYPTDCWRRPVVPPTCRAQVSTHSLCHTLTHVFPFTLIDAHPLVFALARALELAPKCGATQTHAQRAIKPIID